MELTRSLARERLAGEIKSCQAAQSGLERLSEPATRFGEMERAAQTARQRVAELQREDSDALAEWVERNDGSPRPKSPAALATAEKAAAEAERDGRAAAIARERIEPHVRAAGQRVREAAAWRDAAACAVSVEEAAKLSVEIQQKLEEIAALDGRLSGICEALVLLARRPATREDVSQAALSAADQVRTARSNALSRGRIPPATARASSFLDRLRTDPDAKL